MKLEIIWPEIQSQFHELILTGLQPDKFEPNLNLKIKELTKVK